MHRRTILTTPLLGAAGAGLAACGGLKGSGGGSSTGPLKIGYVSPQTGSLASFALADDFIVKRMRTLLAKGITAGGKKRDVSIIVRDSQSTSNRAAEVAKQLIFQDKVDLVVTSSTPDTTNPVADQCEANGVPNVATICPWEAWFFGRGKKDGQSFQYSTMFFLGVEDLYNEFSAMWKRMDAGTAVGCLWPNDTDANAFREAFPPLMTKAGYKPVDAGAYQDGISDFSSQIAKFKSAGADLFTCTPLPPDFQTFWKQAAQQGYRPKLATVAKVMLFPGEAEALGSLTNNIATDVWWSPDHPYKSTLDGSSAGKLSDDFTADTGKQWTQALGSIYTLFEIAVQAFTTASDPTDKKELAHQLKTMKIDGMSGTLDFTSGPQAGIAIQKIVGGQWRKGNSRNGKQFPWDMYLVDNTHDPGVKLTGDLQATA